MADYRVVARQKAQRYGVDPRVFERQIQAESGFNPHAQSGAGAKGIAQFIDSTAKQYGVNVNDPISSLDGAARLMRDALKKSGGDYKKALSIYNSGRPDGYLKFAETKNYVAKILGGVTPQTTAPRAEPARSAASGTPAITGTPATPAGLTRPQILQQYLAQRGRPGALLGLAQGLGDLQTPAAPSQPAAPAAAPTTTMTGAGPFKPGDPVLNGTGIGGRHETAGLAGYPAKDYFAKPGSVAVAPVSGRVVRLSGHDPAQGPTNGPHGPLGWSVYIQGSDGHSYFLTHMGTRTVKVGQTVKAGQPLGTVANYDKYGTPSHIHMGVK